MDARGGRSHRARRLFLHVGTHKTGTTSLQHVLSTRAQTLAPLGFLYPVSGRSPAAPHGHHNLAWEITGDYRFRKEDGAAAELLAEIGSVPHDVILSSEDFECSIHRLGAFAAWIRELQSASLSTTALVYLRHQADYVCTLFLTLLHFELDRCFEDFLEEILERGACTYRNWTLSLCYRELLAAITAVPSVGVIVRSYHEASRHSLIADALGLLGLTPHELGASTSLFANARMGVRQAVELFCQHRLRRVLSDAELRVVDWLGAALVQRPLALSARNRQRLCERFAASNRAVEQRHDLSPLERFSRSRELPREPLCMETLFSAALPTYVEAAARELGESGTPPDVPPWLGA